MIDGGGPAGPQIRQPIPRAARTACSRRRSLGGTAAERRGFHCAPLHAGDGAHRGRKRYERHGDGPATAAAEGHRHGHRERTLTGTFGAVAILVPRARLAAAEGGTREWKSSVIPAYQRRTRQAEALIAGAYLSGTSTRRVRRALAALFGGTIGKDIVSRASAPGRFAAPINQAPLLRRTRANLFRLVDYTRNLMQVLLAIAPALFDRMEPGIELGYSPSPRRRPTPQGSPQPR